jgi:recombinational DNA repair protein RecR
MPDPIDHLTGLFEKFPGIGARQAQRFVHFLLKSSPALRREIALAAELLDGKGNFATKRRRGLE